MPYPLAACRGSHTPTAISGPPILSAIVNGATLQIQWTEAISLDDSLSNMTINGNPVNALDSGDGSDYWTIFLADPVLAGEPVTMSVLAGTLRIVANSAIVAAIVDYPVVNNTPAAPTILEADLIISEGPTLRLLLSETCNYVGVDPTSEFTVDGSTTNFWAVAVNNSRSNEWYLPLNGTPNYDESYTFSSAGSVMQSITNGTFAAAVIGGPTTNSIPAPRSFSILNGLQASFYITVRDAFSEAILLETQLMTWAGEFLWQCSGIEMPLVVSAKIVESITTSISGSDLIMSFHTTDLGVYDATIADVSAVIPLNTTGLVVASDTVVIEFVENV